MGLNQLKIERFRLIQDTEIDLAPGINLFVGSNAQGKTTILEAIGYMATGRSFRTSRDQECISWFAEEDLRFAAISGTFNRHQTTHQLRLALQHRAKSVWLDGKALRTLTSLWGLMPVVFFAPADLTLLQGPPAQRRTLFDTLIGQTNPAYLPVLGAMNKALANRNSLLKRRISPTDPQYRSFEQPLAESMAQVIRARSEIASELATLAQSMLQELTHEQEKLAILYLPGFVAGAEITPELIAMGTQAVSERLLDWWEGTRATDLERGMTRDGAHRDEFAFQINEADVRSFASQGQTRSCVLALRLAELAYIEAHNGEKPVLLLDDVLGELDRTRAEQFLAILNRKNVQALITATDATGLEEALSVQKRFHVQAGEVLAD